MPALPPVAVEPDEPLRVRLLRFAGGAVLIVPLPDRVCLVDHFTTSAYYENLLGSSGSYLARCNPESAINARDRERARDAVIVMCMDGEWGEPPAITPH